MTAERRWKFLSPERIDRDGGLYLWRLNIFKCPWFGLMLHRFYDEDDTCLHDHPWPFVSVILWGGYWEYVGHAYGSRWGAQYDFVMVTRRWYGLGSVLFRRANHSHRIEVSGPVWTLVITGPRWRPWGFFTPSGWIGHEKYKHAEHCT